MQRLCAACATPLRAKRVGEPGPPPIYCSHACRQRAYERRHGYGVALLRAWGLSDPALTELLAARRA
jgi:hypothetical protein